MMMQLYKTLQCRGLVPGSVIISTAGHDRGSVYLVMCIELPFIWLSDGHRRPVDKQKKKRVSHVKCLGQIKQQSWDVLMTDKMDNGQINAQIRCLIKSFIEMNQTKEER